MAISAAFLLALGSLAIFIFTPAAERFARSCNFTPLLLGGLGITGTIEPLVCGFRRITGRTSALPDGPASASLAFNRGDRHVTAHGRNHRSRRTAGGGHRIAAADQPGGHR